MIADLDTLLEDMEVYENICTNVTHAILKELWRNAEEEDRRRQLLPKIPGIVENSVVIFIADITVIMMSDV